MAREVNVTTTNWQATGGNVSVPQYQMSIRIDWTDNSGTPHTQSATVKFPDILLPANTPHLPTAYVADAMRQMLVDAARQVWGVDS